MEMKDNVVNHLRHVAALPDLAGTRYELEREIGRGGMGVVYAARDTDLDRSVALKVLDVPLGGEPRLIAKLEHPAIVPIHESGTLPDGRLFYTMKLVDGERLDTYLSRRHSLAERLRLVRRVGEAIAFAHSRNVIHRDLKPHNVMVGSFGEVYVMDWGVEQVAGTPGFRAPEPVLDCRSDVYALGKLLDLALPAERPRPLKAIVAKATSVEPQARYQGAAAFLDDIDRFEAGLAVNAWAEPAWHSLYRFWSRNAVLLWLLVAYLVIKFLLFFLRAD